MPKGVYHCTISVLAAIFYLTGSSSVKHPVDIIGKSTGSSCVVKQTSKTSATTRQSKVRNVRETFFSDMDLHNKEAVDLLNQLWHSGGGWKHVTTKDGTSVERRNLPAGTFVDSTDASKGSKHACVRSSGIIKASPGSVINLFLDNSRVSEFNEHIIQVKDIVSIPKKKGENNWTKLSWASGPSYGPFKARDYVSVVNFKEFNNGTFMITNRPAYHPDFPPNKKYVRATLLLVGNIIEPVMSKGNEQHTRLTQVAHINPGGAADTSAAAFVINKLCAVGPPSFIKKLEAAAQKSDRMKNKTNEKSFKMSSIANDINNMKKKWSDMNIPKQIDKKISEKKKRIFAAFTNSRINIRK